MQTGFYFTMRTVGLGLALLSLGACATINEGPALNTPVPAQWTNGATGREPYRHSEAAAWWRGYRDPILTALIDRALA